jgi:hypothetical protein
MGISPPYQIERIDRQTVEISARLWYYATNQKGRFVVMMFMILGLGMFLLPILFRLALKLRLGVPMLYALLMLTAFHSWYQANSALADGIFFALVGLVALSWVATLLHCLAGLVADWREECAVAELLAYRVQRAGANGEYVIHTDDLLR